MRPELFKCDLMRRERKSAPLSGEFQHYNQKIWRAHCTFPFSLILSDFSPLAADSQRKKVQLHVVGSRARKKLMVKSKQTAAKFC